MKAVSSPAQPAGGHTTPADNSCRQLSSVIRCADNFVLPFVSYTLFTVVNFRCADLRLLFFPVHKAVFTYNIETTLCCLVSVYSRLVQSFASLVFRCALMSCLLGCLLSAVEKSKWIAMGRTLGIIVIELDLGWGYLLYFITVMGGQTTSIKIISN